VIDEGLSVQRETLSGILNSHRAAVASLIPSSWEVFLFQPGCRVERALQRSLQIFEIKQTAVQSCFLRKFRFRKTSFLCRLWFIPKAESNNHRFKLFCNLRINQVRLHRFPEIHVWQIQSYFSMIFNAKDSSLSKPSSNGRFEILRHIVWLLYFTKRFE